MASRGEKVPRRLNPRNEAFIPRNQRRLEEIVPVAVEQQQPTVWIDEVNFVHSGNLFN